jgi:hypothetical protein
MRRYLSDISGAAVAWGDVGGQVRKIWKYFAKNKNKPAKRRLKLAFMHERQWHIRLLWEEKPCSRLFIRHAHSLHVDLLLHFLRHALWA